MEACEARCLEACEVDGGGGVGGGTFRTWVGPRSESVGNFRSAASTRGPYHQSACFPPATAGGLVCRSPQSGRPFSSAGVSPRAFPRIPSKLRKLISTTLHREPECFLDFLPGYPGYLGESLWRRPRSARQAARRALRRRAGRWRMGTAGHVARCGAVTRWTRRAADGHGGQRERWPSERTWLGPRQPCARTSTGRRGPLLHGPRGPHHQPVAKALELAFPLSPASYSFVGTGSRSNQFLRGLP